MCKKIIKYSKNSQIKKYDVSFNENLYLECDLLPDNNYKMLKQKRYFTNKELLNEGIFINELIKVDSEDGIILSYNNKSLLLIPVGDDLYYLAFSKIKGMELYSMLYTFIIDSDITIDVSKYYSLFKDQSYSLNLYEKVDTKEK